VAVLLLAIGPALPSDAAKPRPRAPNQFGIAVGGGLDAQTPADLTRLLDGVQAVHATWIRLDINWAVIQRRDRSTYAWSPFDQVVRAARARGLNVLGGILYTPEWARAGAFGASSPPASLGDYATFAHAAARHFGKLGVHAYEIWNEPNNASSWEPAPDPARYTRMLRLAYRAIKDADRKAVVVSGGLSPYGAPGVRAPRYINPVDFLQAMYANGARGAMDAVGWHPYTFPGGLGRAVGSAWSQMADTCPSARSTMAANGDGAKKIWLTEFGAPTGKSRVSLSEAKQAELIRGVYSRLAASSWGGPAFLYTYRDNGAVDPGASPDGGFGLVRLDWTRKPSYSTYRRLATLAARAG
jgi:hypothetical protein